MTKLNRLAVVVAAALSVLVVTGVVMASADKPVLVGIAGLGNDPYWVSLKCGANKEAKARGASLTWYSATSSDVHEAQTNFQSALLKKPDALAVALQPAFSAAIKVQMAKGVPVVSFVPMSPPTEYKDVVSDNSLTAFAGLVTKSAGQAGTVAILGGIPGVAILDARWKPIVAKIKAIAPNVKILDTQYDQFDRNKAASIVSSLLLANPDLKVIYAISGPEGSGAAAAVAQAGKSDTVSVFSYDATPDIVAALKTGTIDGLFAQAPFLMGKATVDAMLDYLKAHPRKQPVKPAKPLNIVVATKVLTRANVNTPAAQPFLYKASCK